MCKEILFACLEWQQKFLNLEADVKALALMAEGKADDIFESDNVFINTIARNIKKTGVEDEFLKSESQQSPRYYTRREVANILHVTLPTLFRYTKLGWIKRYKIMNRVLYKANEIEAAIEKDEIFKYKRSDKE